MKKAVVKKLLSLALMAAMLLSFVPAMSLVSFAVYNAGDAVQVTAFLEQTDQDGVTNAAKLSNCLSTTVDSTDPATWGAFTTWTTDSDSRLIKFNIARSFDVDLVGSLDLTGCDKLEEVTVYRTQIDAIDVSGCNNLKKLECDENQLTTLNLANCSNLLLALCFDNQLTALDLTGCSSLEVLNCENNQLTALDLSDAPNVSELSCAENLLTALDLTGCIKLYDVDCSGNELTTLDLLPCAATIKFLKCNDNALSALDLTGCSILRSVNCDDNQLTSLDLSPCASSILNLYCSGNQIESLDLSGCSNLNSVFCIENQIESLDLTGCGSLTSILCDDNKLTTLDLSDCSSLHTLYIHQNELTSLDLAPVATKIAFLGCSGNNLTALDLTGCVALVTLDCAVNQIAELDLSDSIATLDSVTCSGNQLITLDLSGFNISNVFCNDNLLTSIDLSGCANLNMLQCGNNPLTALDLTGCEKLGFIDCSTTQLATLNLPNCPDLTYLNCSQTLLTDIDIDPAEFANLLALFVHKTPIADIDDFVTAINAMPLYYFSYTKDGVNYTVFRDRHDLTKILTVASTSGFTDGGFAGAKLELVLMPDAGYHFTGFVGAQGDDWSFEKIEDPYFPEYTYYEADYIAETLSSMFAAAPTVKSVTPTGTEVAVSGNMLVITFSEAMDDTVGTVSVNNNAVISNPTWSADKKTLTYRLNGLTLNKTYTVTIADFICEHGVAMPASNTASFSTVKESVGGGSPGTGPIGGGGGGGTTEVTVTFEYYDGETLVSSLQKTFEKNKQLGATDLTIPAGYALAEDTFSYKVSATATVKIAVKALADTQTPDTETPDTQQPDLSEPELSFIGGYPDGTFLPGGAIKRAETIQMLYNLLGGSAAAKEDVLDSFGDVNATYWANNALAWAVEKGYLTGYADDTLRPEAYITRGEMSVLLGRIAADLNLLDALPDIETVQFSDIASHWAKESILTLAAKGIVNGYADGTFRANNQITRAETVVMIARLVARTEKYKSDKTFSDVPATHWAYANIMNAANGAA